LELGACLKTSKPLTWWARFIQYRHDAVTDSGQSQR